ncbi:DUF6115 domain-containing protein [Clostridium botulinum]|uniref:Helix-turn-helix domain-containing protein n=2 Tax=Clostridium botulinum TaxID=1491 RepID=A0A9Q1V0E2_CLOBO|nr:hypothetical protein [Clostridium botulinum]AEB75831.1 conserved protein [Clostridium botulinum BKT015925]KEH98621.1 hypothetical protein Z953_13090 [Clostridium botulinum D str. 16868]KEI05715.1 hypothetical protein Y848_03255 [Clostridium botulinum C/D str. Sp77]KLU75662.1 hypothetical protein CBC3_07850 [Clostridium botulinum V891]KOA75265.1 hypothetical protein ADU78_08745 [Clostridium botulinum]
MGTAIMLLIIGILLIFINVKAINKEKNSFKGILNKEEVNLQEVQVEIGKLRKEFAETLLELQTEILELKKKINNKESIHKNNLEYHKENENNNDKIEDIVDIDFDKVKNVKNDQELKKSNLENYKETNSLRLKQVQELIDKGLSIEEIADILKVGKGEILLIRELYLK